LAEPGPPGLRLWLRQLAPIPLAVELDCGRGLTAIVGPSGSGKTTILRAVAGLYRPQRGRISVGGRAWLDTEQGIEVRAHHRRVGLVFQSYALFPHLTAQANIMAAMGHVPRVERPRRALELLALVHLDGLGQRWPAELSGGQQQRVAVARALARDPEVLLLDEPFSAVDRTTREKLHRELAALRQRLAMPVLLVTHDLGEAMALADRLVVLHHGRTLQTDTPSEVLLRPKTAEVARLIGHRNVFDGEIASGAGDEPLRLVWGPYRLECSTAPAHQPSGRLRWVVPSSHVILHRRDRPSRGEHENPVPGKLKACIPLGDTTSCELEVDGVGETLAFAVPTHVARRNGLAVGEAAIVSLLADGIHLMPWA
jgi:molybdate transport system ATP-binding protein